MTKDFRWLYGADAGAKLGVSVSSLAVPLTGVAVLAASPLETGVLGMLNTCAFLVIGLPAGAWVDRLRKRPLMVTADLVRAASLVSVPVAQACGVLTLGQLYVVVLVTGIATVFGDVAAMSFLPALVGKERLTRATSALVSLDGVNQVAGRSLGGFLVAVVSAPMALGVTAASYLWSAFCLARIRFAEPAPSRGPRTSLRHEIGEGLRLVFGHPHLRLIAFEGSLGNCASMMVQVMLPIVFVARFGQPELVLGLFLAAGGAGYLLGSAVAPRLGCRLGERRAIWWSSAVAPCALLLPLVDESVWVAGAAWALTMSKSGAGNVLKVSYRTRVTPEHLLGRMTATMRFLFTGALAVGAGLGGVLGQLAGVDATLWAAAAILSSAWLLLGPVRESGRL
ncbi:hypothetical protein BKM31_13425 [[Actinomadura] parvosata subsp. kistnae]|uniref:MFS transporter n=1 Tax=[Actinomadura] parvosata subsp. kistnae TaxID=1909395 RepID=A0A1U9ZWM2_9ACTN|nr:MFS transporter [Nonomuraea sp. ATCC 55076]AQZ62332.1 hypothetical protein BKM31_13425 [Nonomuraea sp. ATCC 55076]